MKEKESKENMPETYLDDLDKFTKMFFSRKERRKMKKESFSSKFKKKIGL